MPLGNLDIGAHHKFGCHARTRRDRFGAPGHCAGEALALRIVGIRFVEHGALRDRRARLCAWRGCCGGRLTRHEFLGHPAGEFVWRCGRLRRLRRLPRFQLGEELINARDAAAILPSRGGDAQNDNQCYRYSGPVPKRASRTPLFVRLFFHGARRMRTRGAPRWCVVFVLEPVRRLKAVHFQRIVVHWPQVILELRLHPLFRGRQRRVVVVGPRLSRP